jgi:hypothetical protein
MKEEGLLDTIAVSTRSSAEARTGTLKEAED